MQKTYLFSENLESSLLDSLLLLQFQMKKNEKAEGKFQVIVFFLHLLIFILRIQKL